MATLKQQVEELKNQNEALSKMYEEDIASLTREVEKWRSRAMYAEDMLDLRSGISEEGKRLLRHV